MREFGVPFENANGMKTTNPAVSGTRYSLGLMVRSRAHPISGLPEIGRVKCPSRLKPTWVRDVSNHGVEAPADVLRDGRVKNAASSGRGQSGTATISDTV